MDRWECEGLTEGKGKVGTPTKDKMLPCISFYIILTFKSYIIFPIQKCKTKINIFLILNSYFDL